MLWHKNMVQYFRSAYEISKGVSKSCYDKGVITLGKCVGCGL